MKTIRHTATLFHYDGPQIIEARDQIGGHYLAVMVDPSEANDRYLVVGVPPEVLRRFRSGFVDLRELLVTAGQDEWYLARTADLAEPLMLEPQAEPLAGSALLPDQGFILHDPITDGLALREARARNNLVFEFASEPPEAADEHRIRAATLAGLLMHTQTLIKHAYGAALRKLQAAAKRGLDKTDAYLLDVVVPAMAGSFRVVMSAAKGPDLLTTNELSRALYEMDALFVDVDDPKKVLEAARAHQGHMAAAYLRLLRFLQQHKTGFRYSWAEPGFTTPVERAIPERYIDSLVEVLSGVSDLGGEQVTIVGEFEKANRGSGAWGLLTEDGLRSGCVREGGPSLAGLKIGARYKFDCVEEIEEREGTGREQRTLYLVSHEPA